MQVLIADDDPLTRTILQQFVTHLGDIPVVAEDGDRAWELWQAMPCRAVISDWSMPGIDGLELLRRIRAADGAAAYTYFILLTAHDEPAAIGQAFDAGVDDHLAKPIRKPELRARLAVARRLLDLHREIADRSRLLADANRRMRRDLAAAAGAQKALLPATLPALPGYTLGWRYQPCEECAGDLLGVQALGGNRLGLWVFDVSGHGVTSALLAVQVARELPHLARAGGGPLAVAHALNELFFSPRSVRFLTLVYGELDLSTHHLSLVSCAHPSPLLRRADGRLDTIEIASNPLGMFPPEQVVFQTWETELQPGDRLLLVSDGALEVPEPEQPFGLEIFGPQRLGEAWVRDAGASVEDALTTVMDALAVWRGTGRLTDDITLLGLARAAD